MTSLYVGDLHPDVTEQMLHEMFMAAGPILSIRVCRDNITLRSRGFAFVKFQQHADAERALHCFNFEEIMGQPVRLMWAQDDATRKKHGEGNIFIKNLEKSIDSANLFDTFSAFGNVLSCKVASDEYGSKGFGFVQFETHEAAERAVQRLNGMLFNDVKVFIGHFKKRHERQDELGARPTVTTDIFVKNLGQNLDEGKLKEVFDRYGPTVRARVVTEDSGESRGFGFVSFERQEDAQKAVDDMNRRMLNGRQVIVGIARRKDERKNEAQRKSSKQEGKAQDQGVDVCINNLDDSVDRELLKKKCSLYGSVTGVKVVMEGGRSKGFGFVRFSSAEEATMAVNALNGSRMGTKCINVKVIYRKEERHAQQMPRTATGRVLPNWVHNPYQAAPNSGYYVAAIPKLQRPST